MRKEWGDTIIEFDWYKKKSIGWICCLKEKKKTEERKEGNKNSKRNEKWIKVRKKTKIKITIKIDRFKRRIKWIWCLKEWGKLSNGNIKNGNRNEKLEIMLERRR